MKHSSPNIEATDNSKALLGFWIYLMTDCLVFASLFATFIVLRQNTAGGPNGAELFSLGFVMVETLVLLTSSFTAGMAIYYGSKKQLEHTLLLLAITFILGAVFVAMEATEFSILAAEGSGWTSSGFASAYTTLVGTHGLHIVIGLLWLAVLLYMLVKKGFSTIVQRRLVMWGIFWHFLDIVWIFIFTIVYLMGALE